jgi:hypothetical protein
MATLLLSWLMVVGFTLVALSSYLVMLARLVRRRGWRAGVMGVLCAPYVYLWGLRRRRDHAAWMTLWTGAALGWLGVVTYLELATG